jgi:hypothetical protein
MAATQDDIDALTRAIAAGERQVTIGNQSVTYRSISELIAARNELQRELDSANPVKRAKQYRVYQAGRGYNE